MAMLAGDADLLVNILPWTEWKCPLKSSCTWATISSKSSLWELVEMISLYLIHSSLQVTELLCIIHCQPHKWPHRHKKMGALAKLSKSHITKASLWCVILNPNYGFMMFSFPGPPEHRTNSMPTNLSSLFTSTEVHHMYLWYLHSCWQFLSTFLASEHGNVYLICRLQRLGLQTRCCTDE